jgi:hypothetical protein
MHLRFLTCVLLLVASPAFAGDWKHAPRSEDYAVHEKFVGKPAPVVLVSSKDRLFKTVLRQQAKKGANFAGHYTMAVFGCGMDSFLVAVIDEKTGHVYWPPFGCISLAGGFGITLPEGKGDSPNPAFRIDSRLFLTVGIEDKEEADPKDRAVQFWIFDSGRFTLLYSIPAPFE